MQSDCVGQHVETGGWAANPVGKTASMEVRGPDAASMMAAHLLLGPWLRATAGHFGTRQHFCKDQVPVVGLPAIVLLLFSFLIWNKPCYVAMQ